ncbi:hypothetical protein AB1Y20_003156 [Prymnesium parvum]|uniref:CW-type domain-containing protein n=1 Tax=Prymnesium parvum TaxID=97485 RepID=A0AB34JAP0_PRYPA
MPSARQERAARTGYGVSDVAPAPSASSPADEDLDGAVRCFVSRDASGWRRLCDVCSTSLFNVRLADDDACDAFEACVDCWASVVRGELSWPRQRYGRVIQNTDLRIMCDYPPELMAEVSRKIQAYLSPSAKHAAIRAALERPPLPPPMSAKPVSSLPPLPPSKSVPAHTKSKPPPCKSSSSRESSVDERRSEALESVPCEEFGEGWVRVSKRRSSDTTGRHFDHVWISPEGVRFSSRVKVLRHLAGMANGDGRKVDGGAKRGRKSKGSSRGAAAPSAAACAGKAEGEAEGTWVACDRCGKWRELPDSYFPLPDSWYCELNPCAPYNSCDAPEQEWDEGDDWVEEGNASAPSASTAGAPAAAAAAAAVAPALNLAAVLQNKNILRLMSDGARALTGVPSSEAAEDASTLAGHVSAAQRIASDPSEEMGWAAGECGTCRVCLGNANSQERSLLHMFRTPLPLRVPFPSTQS